MIMTLTSHNVPLQSGLIQLGLYTICYINIKI